MLPSRTNTHGAADYFSDALNDVVIERIGNFAVPQSSTQALSLAIFQSISGNVPALLLRFGHPAAAQLSLPAFPQLTSIATCADPCTLAYQRFA